MRLKKDDIKGYVSSDYAIGLSRVVLFVVDANSYYLLFILEVSYFPEQL